MGSFFVNECIFRLFKQTSDGPYSVGYSKSLKCWQLSCMGKLFEKKNRILRLRLVKIVGQNDFPCSLLSLAGVA